MESANQMTDDRLRRIISQFDSDQAGIRAAAFTVADAIIAEAGLRWKDVLSEIFAVPERQPMRLSGVEFGHVDLCRNILRNDIDVLSLWGEKLRSGDLREDVP
jgi:hypothetical protein